MARGAQRRRCWTCARRSTTRQRTDAALRPLVEEARGQLWTLFAMKKAVIC